tara:strand:+ start:176413 stop:176658 length:246 start_codon:yes stop_codon:yes gene_type:complete
MNNSTEKIKQIVENAEHQLSNIDKTSVDSIGMYDITISSLEISLNLSKEAPHNSENRDLYIGLIYRVSKLREALEIMKSEL